MNISKEALINLRDKLDCEYDNLEKQLNKMYSKRESNEKIKEKLNNQFLIDQQLDLIDNIISSMDRVPIMYNELIQLNEKYNQIVGV